ncbi:tRNA glutamyl-Q(34) synthetase GluQRS [Govanella unica]|uniref:tRNA glutamyl-Q(34) synthetase GluQRS n=1 Tax=Govanella unica TaxID=2975056 RepID=A0A9X3TVT3_9PROT|nr:tRNA glutamyl-Q(34) synthetase GluQRS [Govania unica]MDA5192629.1 tRNA glutamyl-Q(34) synthetase GluQRS [Govania unica]
MIAPSPGSVVTRFAPSPTGGLHLGHAFSALHAYHLAKQAGGRFLLRIEDIDQSRCHPAFITNILEDLAWLGLDWETPVRRQSEHFDDYRAALARLDALGLIYPCFCSRKDITRSADAPHGPEGPLYSGSCRSLSPDARAARMANGGPYALRLDVTKARNLAGPDLWFEDALQGLTRAAPESLGDVVLARRDTPASYHLAVTVDDALQGVTLVTRGTDLFHATHIHRLLQAVLGLPVPRYHHHALLLNADGKRFAKRDKAMTLRDMRASGRTPVDIRREILARGGTVFTAC